MNSSSSIRRRALSVAARHYVTTGRITTIGSRSRPCTTGCSTSVQLNCQGPFLPITANRFVTTRSFFSSRQFPILFQKSDYSTPNQTEKKHACNNDSSARSSINGNNKHHRPIESTLSRKVSLKDLGIQNDKILPVTTTPMLNGKINKKKRNRKRSILLLRPQNSKSVRVKAVHAAQTINIVEVLSKVFGHSTPRHLFGKTGLFLQLPSDENDEALPRFVAIFRYGSVVFVNIPPRQAGKLLEQIKAVGTTKPIPSGFERKEHYEIVVTPADVKQHGQQQPVNGDYCTVEQLDMNSVAVISTIMGQTVALDSFNDTVNELLATFGTINSSVTNTGNLMDTSGMQKSELFKVVSLHNSIFIDMVAKLGIKDRSDMAWNLSQYEQVHQGMKDEFEIEDRFENIEFKLNLIQQNAKFFLEILHNQKSNSLEWIIIVLISFECGLMVLEMSGLGPAVFGIAAG